MFCLRDDTRKVALALPFGEVGGLQDDEYTPNFVTEVVNGLQCDDSGNPLDKVFCAASILYAPFFVLLDMLPSLMEAVLGNFCCCFHCILGGERLILVIIC
jgi:hypothetical protein